MQRIPVWDIPIRVFHWLLVANFTASWLTHELGEVEWHFYSGYSMLVLLLFRLCWGFVGSMHARFVDFLPTPTRLMTYLRHASSSSPGHSPLGALSVITLLVLLTTQVITGLFNADDEGNQGPYHALAPEGWEDAIGAWHGFIFDALLVMLALHLLAIAFYQIKGKALVNAMFSGFKPGQNGKSPPVSLWRALWLLLLSCLLVFLLLQSAPPIETEQYF